MTNTPIVSMKQDFKANPITLNLTLGDNQSHNVQTTCALYHF